MSSLQNRGGRAAEPASALGRIDRLFDEWMRGFPMRRSFGPAFEIPGEDLIRVDEFRDGDTQVIRAELPGVDPEKDIDLSVRDGMLRIDAQRRVEKETEDKGYLRHELRYGSLTRTLPLPDGAAAADIRAGYRDGILEVRVPIPEPADAQPTQIPVSRG